MAGINGSNNCMNGIKHVILRTLTRRPAIYITRAARFYEQIKQEFS